MMDRNEAITRIKAALKRRSGRSWSVTGGHGTVWGWIKVISPPARRGSLNDYHMSPEDCAELGRLLGLPSPVHFQGVSIPASDDYREEYVARAEGKAPAVIGKPYWD